MSNEPETVADGVWKIHPSRSRPDVLKPRVEALEESVARLWDIVERLQTPPVVEPEPEPEAPESHFADLMLADETAEDAKVRLTERLKMLRHYLIAPEIKVNEDGSFGLLKHEQEELQDLERRQAQGRWLDA